MSWIPAATQSQIRDARPQTRVALESLAFGSRRPSLETRAAPRCGAPERAAAAAGAGRARDSPPRRPREARRDDLARPRSSAPGSPGHRDLAATPRPRALGAFVGAALDPVVTLRHDGGEASGSAVHGGHVGDGTVGQGMVLQAPSSMASWSKGMLISVFYPAPCSGSRGSGPTLAGGHAAAPRPVPSFASEAQQVCHQATGSFHMLEAASLKSSGSSAAT